MIIRVPFGTGSMEAELPDSLSVSVVDPKTEAVTGTEEERIEAALDAPIGTARLEETVKPEDKVLIVVNDHTRPGPNRQIVAAVLKRLHKAGVPDEKIRFICATGSHRAPTDKEMRAIAGFSNREMNFLTRALCFAGGMALIIPNYIVSVVGLVVALAGYALSGGFKKNEAKAA